MSDSPVGSVLEPPVAVPGQQVTWGPERVRNEYRWGITLPDGRQAVLGQLVAEMASEPALRRRYVYEVERLASLAVPGVAEILAEILAHGPAPDARDPGAPPPWRLRLDPPGQPRSRWLSSRAPAPVDEALVLVARLAETMAEIHARGAVLRDVEPRCVILGDDGRIALVDVGLARLDILSSRTASSLMLESSPYAAPEHLRATVVDARADVFTLAVILWQALTGTLPFDDDAGILRNYRTLPALATIRPGLPAGLDTLLTRALAENPEDRPASAHAFASLLRGESSLGAITLERVPCQACGELLHPGMRLCLSCGKEAVQLHHEPALPARPGPGGEAASGERYILYLTQGREDEAFLRGLRRFFARVADTVPTLEFVIGDARMYGRDERKALQALPAPLFGDLSRQTAETLSGLLVREGYKTAIRRAHVDVRARTRGAVTVAAGVSGQIVGGSLFLAGLPLVGVGLGVAGLAAMVWGIRMRYKGRGVTTRALARLRDAPAALPASDPYVARLAALFGVARAADLRARLGELALLVQRLCDHHLEQARRAAASNPDPPRPVASIDAMLAEPLDRCITLIEREITAAAAIDEELGALDEGALARAIAASVARRDPDSRRAPLLAGLDRLRTLEDRRAAHLARLLEAGNLLARVVELGLGKRDDERYGDAYLAMALAALDAGDSSSRP